MGSFSVWHWILVLAVGLLLFGGRGKVSELMGDFAKGIKSFKKGLAEDEKPEPEPGKADQMKTIDHQTAPTAARTPAETKAG
jgi:sec-independent protein translocase protein TatA